LRQFIFANVQVKIGTPENGQPGWQFSRKYRNTDDYIYVNMGIPVSPSHLLNTV